MFFFVDAKLGAFAAVRRIFLVAAPITIAMAAFFECPVPAESQWSNMSHRWTHFFSHGRCSAKYRMAETDLSAPLPQASRMWHTPTTYCRYFSRLNSLVSHSSPFPLFSDFLWCSLTWHEISASQ